MLSKAANHKFSKQFVKQWRVLPPKKRSKVIATVELFRTNPQARSLRLHELEGSLAGIRSISAGGDLRLHFRYEGDTVVFFLAVGTHSQLY